MNKSMSSVPGWEVLGVLITLLGPLEARMLARSQAVPSRSSGCALSFPQRPPVGQLPWIHIEVRKDPPGGLQDSGFAPMEGHTSLGRM